MLMDPSINRAESKWTCKLSRL